MLILLSRCVKCFLLQYDHKVHNLAVAFKQLTSGLAGKYEVKRSACRIHQDMNKTCGFYNICFSIEQKMGHYETKSQD